MNFQLNAQSTFYKYPNTVLADRVSLGTPDGGVAIPALSAIAGTAVASNYITDMRTAVEAIALCFTDVDGVGNPAYNWTDLDSSNLYNVVFGGSDYDWERAAVDMADTLTYDVDINEIDQLVEQLENSDPWVAPD